MAGAEVGDDSWVESSVIGAGAVVGVGADLRDVVVADLARVPAGAAPPPGSRIEA